VEVLACAWDSFVYRQKVQGQGQIAIRYMYASFSPFALCLSPMFMSRKKYKSKLIFCLSHSILIVLQSALKIKQDEEIEIIT
jgi:hypothetical protein